MRAALAPLGGRAVELGPAGVGGRGGLASRELGCDGMQCSVRLQGKLVSWIVCGLRSCTRGLHPSMQHQTQAL